MIGRQKRIGDRFDQSPRRQRAPRLAAPLLNQIDGSNGQRRRARQGHGRNFVETVDAQHFLHQIRLADHVVSPGRHGDIPTIIRGRHREAQFAQNFLDPLRRNLDAAKRLDAPGAKLIAALPFRLLAGDDHLAGLAAADAEDQVAGDLGAFDHEGRIDAALEAEAGV